MFITYDYRYYIEGRYIAILQRQQESIYDPYYDVREDVYKTPTEDDDEGILLRYTVSQSASTSETTDLGISRDLALGIVHYVKARLAEERGDMRMREWHYNRFLYYTSKHNSNVKGSPPSMVMVNSAGVVR